MIKFIGGEFRAIILTMLATAIVLFAKLHKIILSPNDYLFSSSIDPFKSYYNFSYLLKYGEGLKHHGINYPYGDHLHYINSHPLYLYVLRALEPVIDLSNYGVGIINLGMLVSIVFATPIIYLILRHFKIETWFAILWALIIQFLFPQFMRINGHFEMVIAPVIPAYWLVLIFYEKHKKKRLQYGIVLMFISILSGFVSAYFAAFCALFTIGLILVKLVDNWRQRRNYISELLSLLVIAVLPLLIIKGFVSYTDWVVDRPHNPGGFYKYNANLFSVFLPDTTSLTTVFPEWVFNYSAEGRAYVGLPCSILMLAIVIYPIWCKINNKPIEWSKFFIDRELTIFLFSAFLVLLFAMCWPFKWGLQFIPENISIIKQFRALGRFSWVFYYTMTVFTACYVFSMWKKLRQKRMFYAAFVLVAFVLSQWTIEAIAHFNKSNLKYVTENRMLNSSNDFYENLFKELDIDVDDYQAMLALPYVQTNGDKMLFEDGLWSFNIAMTFSFHTGIPLVQSFSPRLSTENGLSSIQLLSHPCIENIRLHDMTDQPLLILDVPQKKSQREVEFLSKCKELFANNDFRLLEFDVLTWKTEYANCQYRASVFRDSISYGKPGYLFSIDSNFVFYEGFEFDSYYTEHVHLGKGAWTLKEGDGLIKNINLDQLDTERTYEISCWVYYDDNFTSMPNIYIQVLDENRSFVKNMVFAVRQSHDVDGNWIRVSMQVNLDENYKYLLKGKGRGIVVDDVMIKDLDDEVITISGDKVFYNNYRIHNIE